MLHYVDHIYVDHIDRIDFGEVDFDKSTRELVVFKEVCSINFYSYLDKTVYFSSSNSLKNEAIFTVLETFLWSGEYEETAIDFVMCLQDLGVGPLDLNTLKSVKDMEHKYETNYAKIRYCSS